MRKHMNFNGMEIFKFHANSNKDIRRTASYKKYLAPKTLI